MKTCLTLLFVGCSDSRVPAVSGDPAYLLTQLTKTCILELYFTTWSG